MPADSNPQQTAAKVCIQCKQDCSSRPRLKDSRGRYHCRECVDKATQAREAAAPVAAAPADPGFDELGDAIPIAPADDVAGAALLESFDGGIRPCPICSRPLARTDVVCISCGYNAATGVKIATDHSAPAPLATSGSKCIKCGYNLKGLKVPKCPECGHLAGPGDKRARERELAKQAVRWEYIKPLLQFAIGSTIACAVLFNATNSGTTPVIYMVTYLVSVPVGVAVFWVCCAMWLGFDAPMHLTALRLAGIYAVADATYLVISATMFPLTLLANAISLFVYIGLLAETLEMEIQDAVMVGLITRGTKIALALAIFAYIKTHI
jgi:hypothetical protein